MNREIKFRGYSEELKSFVYGFYYKLTTREEGVITYDSSKTGDWEHELVIDESVGQFTGLHDKNGTEIYEGDVCQITMRYKYGHAIDNEKAIVGFVEFGKILVNDDFLNTYNCFHINNRSIEYLLSHELEVIGNIYENHELLKN